jgi:DNA-binding winged helix-turn-helix (wHTH) protein/tetratricopeptide (TPR) repeat protein
MALASGAGLMNRRFSADDLLRMDASARIPRPIDLAHTPAFQLGGANVLPPTREVVSADRRDVLEPLVMQVLVALHSARGETLSRDDLIDACWGGRAVTDDALNRVITRLRALARDFRGFRIDTITKVGYRLVEDRAPTEPSGLPSSLRPIRLDRRTVVAGGMALAGAAGGYLLLRQPLKHHPPPEAVDLFKRGEIAQRQGFAGQTRQAVSFYQQAVRIDPLYAEAWGGLALSNTHLLEGYGEAELRGVPNQLRSAAKRALELDRDNADAQLAEILIRPSYRAWMSVEAQLRQFNRRHPRHWLGMGRLSNVLFDVGRVEEGVALLKQVLTIDPMLPVGEAYLVNAMLNTDRLQEGEARLDDAERRWPGHPSLWIVHYKLLLFNGRPQAAGAYVMNPDLRPSGMTSEELAPFARLTRALDTRHPAEVAASIEDFGKRAAEDIHNTPMSAAVFALLGRPDLTFASLERYFFNRGSFGPPLPIEPLTRRYARELFSRPLAPLRSDPRFESILQRIGLEDYWRETGTLPDYRHAT